MYRSEMIKNLHELDKKLSGPMSIHIFGSSAAIIKGALTRASGDIDVVESTVPLNDKAIRSILDEIDRSPNDRESWMNQSAREDILSRFPTSFVFDKETIDGESFTKLSPYVISKADFIICKLAIEPEKMRPRDLPDVKAIKIDRVDAKKVQEKLNIIAKDNPALALRIEGYFKQVRPEFVKMPDGIPYTNALEVSCYVKKRYGVAVENWMRESWQNDINNAMKNPVRIIGTLDVKMGEAIDSGNIKVIEYDRKYRASAQKEVDYGMDL